MAFGLSLLWPPTISPPAAIQRVSEQTLVDLDLTDVIRALAGGDERREAFVVAQLASLGTDMTVIRYRQRVVADLLANPELRERLRRLLTRLGGYMRESGYYPRAGWPAAQVARRVRELQHYVALARELRDALDDAPICSAGLSALRNHVRTTTESADFQSLEHELPRLRAALDQARSITIAVNMTSDFVPESATVLSIDATAVEGRATLLERVFGSDAPRGLAALHEVDLQNPGNPLYRDLQKLLDAAVGPVQHAIGRYTTTHAQVLTALEPELHFLLHAAEMFAQLRAVKLPICFPELKSHDERVADLDDAYNVALSLRLIASRGPNDVGIVTNSIAFGPDSARVWILTGPNRGGKTTYTRSVGQIVLLAQAGLPVPASAASLSPVDTIFTHFATQETTELGMGRLDEEAARLAEIFLAATPTSLILLNEVLAGTSTIEALGLAIDAVRGLHLLGARAIYATHLHELAGQADDINALTGGDGTIGSLVALVDAGSEALQVIGPHHRRTFRIVPGRPRNVSYASEIAEQHGISYAQIVETLRRRGLQSAVVPSPANSAQP